MSELQILQLFIRHKELKFVIKEKCCAEPILETDKLKGQVIITYSPPSPTCSSARDSVAHVLLNSCKQ